MRLNDIISYLQGRSPEAKNRIIMAVGAVSVLALGSLWVNSVRVGLSDVDGSDLRPGEVSGSVVTAENRITLESLERRDGKLFVHFNIQNRSSDILNFSPKDRIEFTAGGKTVMPEGLIDRQQGEFVKKVLSQTTAYGTLVFSPEPEHLDGTLTFDDMFFEQSPGVIFKEDVQADLNELKTAEQLRS